MVTGVSWYSRSGSQSQVFTLCWQKVGLQNPKAKCSKFHVSGFRLMPSTQNFLQKSASCKSVTLNLRANRLCKSAMCCWWTHNNSATRTLSLWRHVLIRNSWLRVSKKKKIKIWTKTTCSVPWIPSAQITAAPKLLNSLPATLREVEESFKADRRCPV